MTFRTPAMLSAFAAVLALVAAGCQHKANPPVNPPIEEAAPAKPWGIAVSPDGSTLYVANAVKNSISVYDTAARAKTGEIKVSCQPQDLAVSESLNLLFVSHKSTVSNPCLDSPLHPETQDLGTRLSVVDLNTKTTAAELDIDLEGGSDSREVIVAQNAGRVYLANFSGDLMAMDADNLSQDGLEAIARKELTNASNSGAIALELSPDESVLYVLNSGENAIDRIDASTLKKHASGPISLSGCKGMTDLLLDSDGRYLYATCQGTDIFDSRADRMYRIDLSNTPPTSDRIDVGDRPGEMEFNGPGEEYIYVALQGPGQVAVVDAATFEVVEVIEDRFGFPADIAVAAGQVFVTDFNGDKINFFDAR